MTQTKEKWVVHNPATGEIIGELEETSLDSIPVLYKNARSAYQSWSKKSTAERVSYLKKIRNYMLNHMDEIVETITKDSGKVITEALSNDFLPTVDTIKHIEKHADKILGRQKVKTPILFLGKKSYIDYMPRGVVLVISPWNYPLQLAMVPVISAIAAGNSVILKPTEVTPMVGKCMEKIFKEAGLPEDVVQVAHGGKELGAELTKGKPDYIFFTGSVRTGKIIQAQAAEDLIPTTLELGGKDPMIVMDDANLDRAAKGAVWGAFTNSGQVCMSVERLYVHKNVYNPFLEKLKIEAGKLTQGTDANADVGSMTFPQQLDTIRAHVDDALKNGAVLETGDAPENWDGSMFLKPMILTNVTQDMKIVQEETFGPILPILQFESEDEVISLANDSNYGLNASVWSGDLTRAERIASQLVSGAVLINEVIITAGNQTLPFGGTKQSGIGRYHGEIGLRIFCHEKAVMVDKGQKTSEIQWYPYKNKYGDLKDITASYFADQKQFGKFIKAYLRLLRK